MFDFLSILNHEFRELARDVGHDLVEYLHRFDNANDLAFVNDIAFRYKWLSTRNRRSIEDASHRRGNVHETSPLVDNGGFGLPLW